MFAPVEFEQDDINKDTRPRAHRTGIPCRRTSHGRQVRLCRVSAQTEFHDPHQATVLHDDVLI